MSERGFTLLELLVVVTILPLVVGAIGVALISVFRLQSSVSSRISGSADAETVSASFVSDVQSAALLTTESAPQCGTTGSEVLGLSWNASQTVIAYVELAESKGNSLFRRVCLGGSTTASSISVVSHDVPTGQQATVTCASTALSCAASTGWIGSAGISSVTLTIAEPASGYQYTLTAVPRAWNPVSGGVPAGGVPVLPFQLLGTPSCPAAVLTIAGGSALTVGSGGGTVGLSSACSPSVQINNGGSFAAGAIVTADQNLDSDPAGSGPTESYLSGGPANPYVALTAPSNPSTALVGSCSGTSSVTCTSGEYTSGPSFGGGAAITFTGTSAAPGTFVFDTALTIANGESVSFGNGTYWFKNGLTINATATFGSGIYIVGTSAAASSTTELTFSGGATVTTSGGTLLYAAGGSLTLAGGAGVALTPLSQYHGVTIWDAGGAGSAVSLSNGSSAVLSLGGLYAPSGQVVVTGGGTMTATFVVAGTASLSGRTTLAAG